MPFAITTPPVLSALASLLLTLAIGPLVIRLLQRYVRESIKSDSQRLNELHSAKKETPTMGGLLVVLTFFAGSLASGIKHSLMFWTTIFVAVSLMLLGAADDWIKRTTQSKGLAARQKLVWQFVIGLVSAISLGTNLSELGGKHVLGTGLFVMWSTFVMTGTSNAVNLTDGLDGLAVGCTAITATTLAFILMNVDFAPDRVAVVNQASIHLLALSGSSLGFMWFNRHPARVFMGDAGSLPIGGVLAITALATGSEFVLAVCGLVFVIETLSVFLQVAWYRRTKTRILLCSPLHNHFVFKGVTERRIVGAFWLAAVFCSILGACIARWILR